MDSMGCCAGSLSTGARHHRVPWPVAIWEGAVAAHSRLKVGGGG